MDKTIEIAFFKEFEYSGVAYCWLDWLGWNYGVCEVGFADSKSMESFYTLCLDRVIPQMQEFREKTSLHNMDLLFQEIANNLDECESDETKERYIGSLIKPFRDFSDLYLPIAKIEKLMCNIKNVDVSISEIKDAPADEMLVDGYDCVTPIATVSEQLGQYAKKKVSFELEVDSIKNKAKQLHDLINNKSTLYREYIGDCIGAFHQYYLRLDALLLTHYIDLMDLQQAYGVYFAEERILSLVSAIIGTKELTQYYIDKICAKKAQQVGKESALDVQLEGLKQIVVPSEFATDKAVKVFGKAVAEGLMEPNGDGYKWLKTKVLLAYFCQKISCYLELRKGHLDRDGHPTVSWRPFEDLFGVTRISSGKDGWMKTHTTFHPIDCEIVDGIFD